MSVETGVVETVEGEWAWVRARRKSACGGCSSKGHCQSLGGGQMRIKARNTANANVGDTVEIYLDTRIKMKFLFLLYVVPIFGLMGGAIAAEFLSDALGLGAVTGKIIFIVAGVMTAFVLVRIHVNNLAVRGELSPSVRKILNSGHP